MQSYYTGFLVYQSEAIFARHLAFPRGVFGSTSENRFSLLTVVEKGPTRRKLHPPLDATRGLRARRSPINRRIRPHIYQNTAERATGTAMARTSDGRRRVPVVAGGSRLLVALSLLLGVALISALLPIVIAGSAAVPDSLKAYYTDLEPPAFRAPRRLAYANLFDDESNTFFTVAGKSIAPSELSGSDYPLVTSVVELSEVDGDNGGQAPKSSTPYATAFRVSATVYVAPNKTADPYSSVTVLMWFEEGDVRSFVRVSYTDDDGNEALVDFKNPNTGAPFAKSQTVRILPRRVCSNSCTNVDLTQSTRFHFRP